MSKLLCNVLKISGRGGNSPSWLRAWCMFLVFFPEHMCSDLIRQIKSLLSLNWQVLEVLIVKFQVSTLDHCHHLFINLSCTSASKPLNAQYYTWARSHRGRHYDCALVILYCIYTLLMCTNTACTTEVEQRLCSEALTSEVGLLQNIRACKKWIPLSMAVSVATGVSLVIRLLPSSTSDFYFTVS